MVLIYEMLTGSVRIDLASNGANEVEEQGYIDDWELLVRQFDYVWRDTLQGSVLQNQNFQLILQTLRPHTAPNPLSDPELYKKANGSDQSAYPTVGAASGVGGGSVDSQSETETREAHGLDAATSTLAMLRIRCAVLEYTQRSHAHAPPDPSISAILAWLVAVMRVVNDSARPSPRTNVGDGGGGGLSAQVSVQSPMHDLPKFPYYRMLKNAVRYRATSEVGGWVGG